MLPALHATSALPYPVTELAPLVDRIHARVHYQTGEVLARGLANNPPVWQPVVGELIARIGKPVQRLMSADAEAAAVALHLRPPMAAAASWLALGGVTFALRALARASELANFASICRDERRDEPWAPDEGLWLVERPDRSFHEFRADAWALLRCALAETLQPHYDAAHRVAERLRAAAPPDSALPVLLAFAFPDEPSWADGLAERVRAVARSLDDRLRNKRYANTVLAQYVAAAPVADALAVVRTGANAFLMHRELLTLLAHRGADGARVIEAAVRADVSLDYRAYHADLLLHVQTPTAARALRSLAGRWPRLRPIARRHPQLGARGFTTPSSRSTAER